MLKRGHVAPYQGFSLTELSIVLLVIALVTGMTLSVGKTQLDVAAFKGTQRHLEILRDSLNLFQKKHKRYPCPAVPTESPADVNYGLEATGCDAACPAGLTCDGNAVIGFVPFKTLKLGEKMAYDNWDHKITYVLDKTHTASSEYNNGSIPVVDVGGNKITQSPVFGDSIFVLVSHGEDGAGAYDKQGAQTEACGAMALDIENCDGNTTFRDTAFNNGSDPAAFFDDLVLWQAQENIYLAEEAEEAEEEEYPFASGWRHNCYVKNDGTSWCWGYNSNGQLGDGTTTDKTTPTQVTGLTDVVSFALGNIHSCALKTDGTVWCWGSSANGRLGTGLPNPGAQYAPVQVTDLSNEVVKLAAGDNHACAVKSDGTVWCWGDNGSGRIGDGTTNDAWSPVQVLVVDHNNDHAGPQTSPK